MGKMTSCIGKDPQPRERMNPTSYHIGFTLFNKSGDILDQTNIINYCKKGSPFATYIIFWYEF